MRGVSIGKVIATKSSKYNVGDYVSGNTGWAEVAILASKDLTPIDLPPNGKLTDALGVLGMTGLTAYFGILEIGKIKAGDFVVVSGAAGATGSVVCQIAKIKGAKVLGLAGSDDKVQWLKDLGCDEALNYKDKEFASKFKAATPNFIDVFFDNVGGDILELALSRAKPFSTFVICGAISQYNSEAPVGPKVCFPPKLYTSTLLNTSRTSRWSSQCAFVSKVSSSSTSHPNLLRHAKKCLNGWQKASSKEKRLSLRVVLMLLSRLYWVYTMVVILVSYRPIGL